MSNFLDAYSIQHWLESCPQGYLAGSEHGHAPGDLEPEILLTDPTLREQALRVTVQLVVGERCALAASSGLINAAPDEASKRFLATQTLDEARHVEIFTQRLFDLGVKDDELEDLLIERANPNLVQFAQLLLETVDRRDFVAGVVGQNVILEGMAFSVFEMMHAANQASNPKFARTLSGTIADERRHVGFGENRIGSLVREHPEKKDQIERLQEEMSYFMLATFADQFRSAQVQEEFAHAREVVADQGSAPGSWHGVNLATAEPAALERALANTVLRDFKQRLSRMGLEYRTPRRP